MRQYPVVADAAWWVLHGLAVMLLAGCANSASTGQPATQMSGQHPSDLDTFLAGFPPDRIERAELKLPAGQYTAAIVKTVLDNNQSATATLGIFDAHGKLIYQKSYQTQYGCFVPGMPTTVPDIPRVIAYTDSGGSLGKAMHNGLRLIGLGNEGPKEIGLSTESFGTMPAEFVTSADLWVEDIDRDGKPEVCWKRAGWGTFRAFHWSGSKWVELKMSEDRMPALPLQLACKSTYVANKGELQVAITLTNTGKSPLKLSRGTKTMLHDSRRSMDGLWVRSQNDQDVSSIRSSIDFKGTIEPGKSETLTTSLQVGNAVGLKATLLIDGWVSWDNQTEPLTRTITISIPTPTSKPE